MKGLSGYRLRAWHIAVLVAATILADCLFTSVWMVGRDERGVVLRLGRHVRNCGPGMHLTLPFPFERIEVVATTEVRSMPVGFRLVDRTRGIGPAPDEVQWLTGDTNIVEIQAVVQYVVADPAAYLFNVAELSVPDAGFEESRHRRFVLRKATESVLTALVARMRVDDVLSSGKARLQIEARQKTQEQIDALGLGLQVLSIHILEGNPPAEVIAAFNEVSSAKADNLRALSEADGYRKDLLPRARARAFERTEQAGIYRSEVLSAANSAATRFRSLAKEVRAAPEVSLRRLWLESVEEALAKARLVLYPPRPGSDFILREID